MQHCNGWELGWWGCSIAALQWGGSCGGGVQHCSTAWGWIMWGGGATLQHCMGVLWGGCSSVAPRGGAVGGLQHCSTAWGCCVVRLQHCSTAWGCCVGVAALQQHMGVLWGVCSTAAPR